MESRSPSTPTFRDLYPDLNERELEEAERNFERYLEVALRIWERLEHDPDGSSPARAFDAGASKPLG